MPEGTINALSEQAGSREVGGWYTKPLQDVNVWVWVMIAAAFVTVFALAVTVRVMTYERYLPVLDHVDESFRFIHAYQVRPDAPLGDQYGEIAWTVGFPPMQVWVGVWSQRLVERFVNFPFPPDYIRALRGFSAVLNVGTVVFLALTGWLLGRRLGAAGAAVTGVFAAVVWAVAPRIVGTGNLALMDPLIFPMTAAALFFTVYSIQQDVAWAAVAALAAVIVAIYTKYVLIYALWLPFCAVAVLIWRRRWRALPWIVGMGVLSAVTAGWLVFVHNALALDNREATNFREEGLANMLSPVRNWDNLLYTLQETTGAWLFAAVIVAGVAAWWLCRRRGVPTVRAGWLAVFVPYVLGSVVLASSVDILRTWEPDWYRVRYTLPAAQALLLMFGIGAGQVFTAISVGVWRGGAVSTRTQPLHRVMSIAVMIALFAVIVVPSVGANLALAREYSGTHTYERIWAWSDASIPNPEGKFITAEQSSLAKTWNRPWVGYNGATSFDWVHDDNPQQQPVDYFWERGITYFAATDGDFETIFTAPGVDAWRDDLFRLKTIPPADVGDFTAHFYRLKPPGVQADARFGENIALVGYDLSAETVQPGDMLVLRPFWQASSPPDANYSMFVHLLPADDTQPVAQFDGAPASERRLPITWTDADEVLLGTQATIPVPEDVPPGEYRLAVGLYNFETGARLPLPNGDDVYMISVTVAP